MTITGEYLSGSRWLNWKLNGMNLPDVNTDHLDFDLPDFQMPDFDLDARGQGEGAEEFPFVDGNSASTVVGGEAVGALSEIADGFRRRREKEQARYELATDSEYWFCVCFQTREQKEIFIEAMKWGRFGDKYIDGVELAESMGVVLPSSEDVRFVTEKQDPKLSELSAALPVR